MSSNPVGRVSRGFCVKKAATSMEAGARWPVAASPEIFFLVFWLLFLGFSHFYFAECFFGTRRSLCRVPDKKHSQSLFAD